MQNTYSFLIGVRNTLIAWVGGYAGLYFAAHPAVANLNIVDFVTMHLPVALGTLTVGGLVSLVLDYLHQTYNIAAAQRASAGK